MSKTKEKCLKYLAGLIKDLFLLTIKLKKFKDSIEVI